MKCKDYGDESCDHMNKKIKMPVGSIAIKEGEFVGLDGEWHKFPKTQYCLMCENYAKLLVDIRRQRDLENVKQKRCKQIISKLKKKVQSLTPKMITLAGMRTKVRKLSKSDQDE